MGKNMIVPLLFSFGVPIFITSVGVIVDRIRKKHRNKLVYVGFFLLVLLLNIWGTGLLHAEEHKIVQYETIGGPTWFNENIEPFYDKTHLELISNLHRKFDLGNSLLDNSNMAMTIGGPMTHEEVSQGQLDLLLLKENMPAHYDKKIKEHKQKGGEAFLLARDKCIYLPDNKREMAYALFQDTLQASLATALWSYPGLITSLITSLARYGCFVCERCFEIREALDNCEYHYNMMVYCMRKKEEQK